MVGAQPLRGIRAGGPRPYEDSSVSNRRGGVSPPKWLGSQPLREIRAGGPRPYEDSFVSNRRGEVPSPKWLGNPTPTRNTGWGPPAPTKIHPFPIVGAGFPRPNGWGAQPLRGIRAGGPNPYEEYGLGDPAPTRNTGWGTQPLRGIRAGGPSPYEDFLVKLLGCNRSNCHCIGLSVMYWRMRCKSMSSLITWS